MSLLLNIRDFPDAGYIYLIKDEIYKIGFTKKYPTKRLSELQCANYRELILFDFFKTSSIKIETKIHKYFKHRQIRREWFNLTEYEISNILDSEWRLLELSDDYYDLY